MNLIPFEVHDIIVLYHFYHHLFNKEYQNFFLMFNIIYIILDLNVFFSTIKTFFKCYKFLKMISHKFK